MGLLSVVQTILLNISESTRELALLRAVGATASQVRGIILAQSGLLAGTGAASGALIACACCCAAGAGAATIRHGERWEQPASTQINDRYQTFWNMAELGCRHVFDGPSLAGATTRSL